MFYDKINDNDIFNKSKNLIINILKDLCMNLLLNKNNLSMYS